MWPRNKYNVLVNNINVVAPRLVKNDEALPNKPAFIMSFQVAGIGYCRP